LAIDATAARRHFAALLLDWPNDILTCLLRAKNHEYGRIPPWRQEWAPRGQVEVEQGRDRGFIL